MKARLEAPWDAGGGLTLGGYFAARSPDGYGGVEQIKRTFRDRSDAGQQLAGALTQYANRADVLVLGLPRGGVPVAAEMAKKLNLPLDILVVRKLGVPFHPELAMGAIAGGGVRIVNQEVVDALGIGADDIERVASREHAELERREKAYRSGGVALAVTGKTVLLIDDGIATGSTILAGIAALRELKAARIVVATPTAPPSTCRKVREAADDVVALIQPENFYAVGQWYDDFGQTRDEEVTQLLTEAKQHPIVR